MRGSGVVLDVQNHHLTAFRGIKQRGESSSSCEVVNRVFG